MSKKTIKNVLFWIWPLALIISTLLSVYIPTTILHPDSPGLLSVLQEYVKYFLNRQLFPLVTCSLLAVLLLSIILWLTKPNKLTFLFSLFAGWVLCGFPMIYILHLLSMRMPGDGPISYLDMPYSSFIV